jgi:hypothetical protein
LERLGKNIRDILDVQSIRSPLDRNVNNSLAAAREVGIHKITLFWKMKKFGIPLPEQYGRRKSRYFRELLYCTCPSVTGLRLCYRKPRGHSPSIHVLPYLSIDYTLDTLALTLAL